MHHIHRFGLLLVLSVVAAAENYSEIGIGHKRRLPTHPECPRNASFGELAIQTAKYFDQVLLYADDIDARSEPLDTKDVRYAVTAARDYADLFVFAYPLPSDPGDDDTWQEVRNFLDWGHNVIGTYKDIDDARLPCTQEERERLLDDVLEWKSAIQIASPRLYSYLLHPSPNEFFYRRKTIAKKGMWGALQLTPDPELKGIENIARLLAVSFDEAVYRLKGVRHIPHRYLLEESNLITLHNFRKYLRSLVDLAAYYPCVLEDHDPRATELMAVGNALYKTIGDIMDMVTAYRYYVDHDDDAAIQRMAMRIHDSFDDMVEWTEEVGATRAFRELADMLFQPEYV